MADSLGAARRMALQSHICVLQTTLDLLDLGVGVFVLADGVSSSNKQEIGVALEVSGVIAGCAALRSAFHR